LPRVAPALILTALAFGCERPAPTPPWLRSFAAVAFASGRPLPTSATRVLQRVRSDSLASPRLLGDSTAFGRISSIRVVGDRLLVTEVTTGYHVAVVNRGSGVVEKRLGRHGEGPGEFRDPRWTHRHPASPNLAWVYDYSLRRMTLVRLDGEQREWLVRTVRLDQGPYLSEPVMLGKHFVSNGYFVDHTLTVADTQWQTLTHLAGEPISLAQSADPLFRTRVSRSRIAVDPAHSRLVLAYQSANRLDIFDSNLQRRGTVAGPRTISTSVRTLQTSRGRVMRWGEGNELAYVSVDASREHIFALFCGKCDATTPPRLVHVFNWDGLFVSELVLDRPVETIAVSSDGDTLYGATGEPYPAIAAWAVPIWNRPPF
jgi:hypothetical protein